MRSTSASPRTRDICDFANRDVRRQMELLLGGGRNGFARDEYYRSVFDRIWKKAEPEDHCD